MGACAGKFQLPMCTGTHFLCLYVDVLRIIYGRGQDGTFHSKSLDSLVSLHG